MSETGDPRAADLFYRGFPDFAEWQGLTAEDLELWDRFAARLEERRQAATPETLQKALDVVIRAAALDTGAIEGLYSVDRGFTMTVAVQGLAWEHLIEERGAGVRALFEAQLEAYELVLDAVTRKLPVTEAWIRALHEKLCAPQKTYRVLTEVGWQEQELPKGRYKNRPNHVRLTDGSFHAYAPVDLVPAEMHRLLEQLRTPAFEAAHPVLQASYAHYALVVIHPFADGNGRVARAVASTFFYRAQSIPLLIFADRRPAYLDALQAADRGDPRPFIGFFRDRGIDTIQLVVENLLNSGLPTLEAVAQRIAPHVRSDFRLSPEDLDAIGGHLLVLLRTQLRNLIESAGLSDAVTLEMGEDPIGATPGYRRIGRTAPRALLLLIGSPPPENLSLWERFRVLVATDAANPFTFSVEAGANSDRLEIRLEEVSPQVSESFKLRLASWAQRHLVRLLAEAERRMREQAPG